MKTTATLDRQTRNAPPQVEAAAEELGTAIAAAERTFAALGNRLGPVLRPAAPARDVDVPGRHGREAPLAIALAHMACRVDALTAAMTAVADRVEV